MNLLDCQEYPSCLRRIVLVRVHLEAQAAVQFILFGAGAIHQICEGGGDGVELVREYLPESLRYLFNNRVRRVGILIIIRVREVDVV